MRVTRGIPAAAATPAALTIGNFDGVHLGHQAMLAELKRAAGRLGLPACVLTFEPHPREFFAPDKAPTRLTSLREKLELLAGCGVDRVHICRFGARRAGSLVMLKQAAPRLGFEVAAIASVMLDGERVSSTALRQALAAGDLDRAGRLLGRAYSISGRVVAGDGLGRKLGFPTANVQMRRNHPPFTGIFTVRLHGAARGPLNGVASLGVRPTVKQQGAPVLEVHALDFAGDLYRRHVRVEFLRKLRDEEKYADLATLTRQIALDAKNARAFFEGQSAPAPRRAG